MESTVECTTTTTTAVTPGRRTRIQASSCSESTCSSTMTLTSDDLGAIGLKNFDEFSPLLPKNREHYTTRRDIVHRRDTFPPIKHTPSASLLISDSIELNVGGVIYVTSGWILAREHTSWLATSLDTRAILDRRGRFFIDRDGDLFRFVLDYLQTGLIQIPKDYPNLELLRNEASFYGLKIMKRLLKHIGDRDINDPRKGNYVTLTEHSTFNVKCRENVKVVFKRVSSITVAGYVKSCRKIFGNKLSLDRDSSDTQDRYSCRMVIVQGQEATVFDTLEENGYELISDNKTDGTTTSGARNRSDYIHEENMRWTHVTNYYFRRKNITTE